ncbi:MAG: PTS transporter subunit EIIC [Mycoplasmatales bacterium]
MNKYEKVAKQIVKLVGGKENIVSLTHCITRLRFKLSDESIADEEKLGQIDKVVTVMKSGGQFQVVIGNEVAEVYSEIEKIIDIDEEVTNDDSEKQSSFNKVVDIISGIFQPVLGMLCATGMLKGLNTLFEALNWYSSSDGIFIILNAIGDALFMFLPIILGYTAAKKFGLKPFIGLVIGAVLCYPAIQGGAISELGEPLYTLFSGTMFESDVYLEFLGFPIIAMDYTSTVIPVIIIIYFASKVNKLFDKIVPGVVKFFMLPMITLTISLVLGILILGPIATFASDFVSVLFAFLFELSPLISGALVGLLWQVLVIFGLHWGIIPLYVNNIATLGFDQIMMPFFATTFTQAAVILVIFFKTKDKKLKEISIPAMISCIFGVSEPAIYGITLPLKKPFIISCIASGIAGGFYGINGFRKYIQGGSGIFELPGMINPETGDFYYVMIAIIGIAIAVIISIILMLVFYKEKDTKKEI